MLFHPKRYFKLLPQRLMTFSFIVQCKKHHIALQMGKGIIIRNCKVIGRGGLLSIGDFSRIDSVTFILSGNDNRITIGMNSVLRDGRVGIHCKDNGVVSIGKKSSLNGAHLGVYDPYGTIDIHNCVTLKYADLGVHGVNGIIDIRDSVSINGNRIQRTSCCVSADHTITIMDYSILSNSITISTTDFHAVFNESGERINNDKDVFIGEHVWIGEHCYICKGVSIANNCIVGACSVVTKSFEESNSIIAGNPATIKKERINWSR